MAEASQEAVRQALLFLPNLPAEDAPDGAGPEDNVTVRSWPDVAPSYADVQRVPHWEIGAALGILDMERGAKLSGSMFPLYRGFGARLLRALTAFALDRHADAYEEVRPPTLVRTETMVSTGQLPKFADDAYHLERDDLWAIPTAEVPLTSMSRGDILDEDELPVRLTAATPASGGSRGRPAGTPAASCGCTSSKRSSCSPTPPRTRRRRCTPTSWRGPRACCASSGCSTGSSICAPATSGSRRPAPSTSRSTRRAVDQWLEVSSISWFRDYQARRGNIRYRPAGGGSPAFVHTLNGSALAWARIWAALVETGRQADGSVALPPVLLPYLRGDGLIPAPG